MHHATESGVKRDTNSGAKAKAQEPKKDGEVGARQAQQPEFDPSDLNTVPGGQGPITPLDVSDQRQLALKLQELSDKVEALQARENKQIGRASCRERV